MLTRWLIYVIFLVAAQTVGAQTSIAQDALAFRIDVGHSGRATLDDFNGKLAHLWTRTFDGGISYPVIANGHIYVTVAAGTATVLYALDPVSGNTIWQSAIPGEQPTSSIAYDDGQIFVLNASGLVEAFDAATGAQHWSRQLPYEWIFTWPPVATRGLIFIGAQGSAGMLYAVDEKNGRVIWLTKLLDAGTPAAYGKLVATGSPCFDDYGFAAKTGEWLWTHESLTSSGGGVTAAYYNSRLFVRDSCYKNLIFKGKNGAKNGTFKSDNVPISFFTLDGSDYIVALVNGNLSATAVGTRTRLWGFKGDGKLFTAPIVVDNYVVEGSTSGELYILDEATGRRVSTYNVGAAINAPQEGGGQAQPTSGLAAADGLLIVPAGSTLVAYAPK